MAHLGSYVAALQYYMLENDWCNQKMFYTNDLLVMKTICHLNNLTLVFLSYNFDVSKMSQNPNVRNYDEKCQDDMKS